MKTGQGRERGRKRSSCGAVMAQGPGTKAHPSVPFCPHRHKGKPRKKA